MHLKNKTALVTGGGGAIGGCIAAELAAAGARVAVCDVRGETAERVAAEIRAGGGDARAFAMDVTKGGQVRAVVQAVSETLDPVEILVNNSGGSAGLIHQLNRFKDTSEEVWKWVIDLNLNGMLHCTHAVLPSMTARRSGRIISVSSIAAAVGILNHVDYAAAKAGVCGATRALAMELGEYGITVNSISPGLISHSPDPVPAPTDRTWLGRWGLPRDVARMVVFLASDDAAFVTGQDHIVDGGRVLGPLEPRKG
jgi:NAD(P)-dependent dehydrogenase (short-subunit alcohol dehydrogenase family)